MMRLVMFRDWLWNGNGLVAASPLTWSELLLLLLVGHMILFQYFYILMIASLLQLSCSVFFVGGYACVHFFSIVQGWWYVYSVEDGGIHFSIEICNSFDFKLCRGRIIDSHNSFSINFYSFILVIGCKCGFPIFYEIPLFFQIFIFILRTYIW